MPKINPSDKSKKHDVLKRVKYKSKQKGERYIDPGQEQVTLGHLSDADYELVIRLSMYQVAGGK